MGDTFLIVAVLLALLWIGAWLWAVTGTGDAWSQIGRGPLSMDGEAAREAERRARRPPDAHHDDAVRDEEIRQLLEARNRRRAAKGLAPEDVETTLRELTAAPTAAADPELVAEVRAHVEARNARRVAAGKPPLDVDAEVRRRLAAADEPR